MNFIEIFSPLFSLGFFMIILLAANIMYFISYYHNDVFQQNNKFYSRVFIIHSIWWYIVLKLILILTFFDIKCVEANYHVVSKLKPGGESRLFPHFSRNIHSHPVFSQYAHINIFIPDIKSKVNEIFIITWKQTIPLVFFSF
jgi:hypothetical protein